MGLSTGLPCGPSVKWSELFKVCVHIYLYSEALTANAATCTLIQAQPKRRGAQAEAPRAAFTLKTPPAVTSPVPYPNWGKIFGHLWYVQLVGLYKYQ